MVAFHFPLWQITRIAIRKTQQPSSHGMKIQIICPKLTILGIAMLMAKKADPFKPKCPSGDLFNEQMNVLVQFI